MLKPMVLEEGERTPPYSWEERSCDIIKVAMAMTKRRKIKILNDSIYWYYFLKTCVHLLERKVYWILMNFMDCMSFFTASVIHGRGGLDAIQMVVKSDKTSRNILGSTSRLYY
jgi:hypothetical protein